MKIPIIFATISLLWLLLDSSTVNAQRLGETKSKKVVVLETSAKVAAELGEAAIKLGAVSARTTAETVVVPAARIIWDPVLTKAAPKVMGGGVKLVGKGIRRGVKFIVDRE